MTSLQLKKNRRRALHSEAVLKLYLRVLKKSQVKFSDVKLSHYCLDCSNLRTPLYTKSHQSNGPLKDITQLFGRLMSDI